MKITEGTQYSKRLIVEQIQDAKRKIKMFLKFNKTTEQDKFILADERLTEAIRWLTKSRG